MFIQRFFKDNKCSSLVLTFLTWLGGSYFLIPDSFHYTQHFAWLVLILAAVYALFRYSGTLKNELLSSGVEAGFAAVITLSLTTGFYFDNGRSFDTMGVFSVLLLFVRTALLVPLMTSVLRLISNAFCWIAKDVCRKPIRVRDGICSFIVIFVVWSVVWLAYWPGLFNYDPWQVDEVMNQTYSTHHPLLHTLFLGNCYRFGVNIGDPNLGLALYCFIQMLLMDSVLSLAAAFLFARFKKPVIPLLVLAYYAFFPANPIMAISSTKDVLFSGLILLAFLLAVMWIESENGIPVQYTGSLKKWTNTAETKPHAKDVERKHCHRFFIALTITLVFVQLFRNNAQYAVLLGAVCSLPLLRKANWRKTFYVLIISFVLFKGADIALTSALSAQHGSIAEAFSIPIQQQGRIYTRLSETGDEPELREKIAAFYDMSQAYYRPERSDLMKFYVRISPENTGEFLKLSLRLLAKYPAESIDAFLYLTEGAWNLHDVTYADVYRGISDRAGVLFTDIKPDYGIECQSRIPGLEAALEKLVSENEYMEHPLLAILFSPAVYVYLFLLFTVSVSGKRMQYMCVVPCFAALLLTILAGPCIIIRYVYPFMLCAPVFLYLIIKACQSSTTEKDAIIPRPCFV
ncbi:MAG: hypothetical protein IJ242_07335 [Clostridia bacterium]|nr:hypothetical protein [Clostridia bacterium]